MRVVRAGRDSHCGTTLYQRLTLRFGSYPEILGYVTTQLGRAVPVVFGPAGFIVSGVKIITCRRASARSIDRPCLLCFILQYVSQVWLVFPCLIRAAPGHGLLRCSTGLSVAATGWPVCHVICFPL